MGGVAPGVATKFGRRTAVAWTGALMVIDPKGIALSWSSVHHAILALRTITTHVGLVDANDKEGIALVPAAAAVVPAAAAAEVAAAALDAAWLLEAEACRTSILADANPEALRATAAASWLEIRIV